MTTAAMPQGGDGGQEDFLASVRAVVAEGPKPRQVALTLLADYWLEPGASVPSGRWWS